VMQPQSKGYERRRNDMRFQPPLKLHCSVG
jgi:hypothetical protein